MKIDLGHTSPGLAYESTVPRHMVHRAAVSEVFLTGGVRCSDLHFQCSAQLPRAHRYFSDHTHPQSHYDMLLLLEVFRQASIYVSHAFLDVSIQDKFIYLDSDTRLLQRSALVMRDCPATALVDVKVVDEYVRNGVRAGVTLDMSLLIQGETAAHKRMGIRWMDEASWNRMRTKAMHKVITHADPLIQLPSAAQPSLVGRAYAGNVVVGSNIRELDGALTVPVIVDQGNAGIFDHPLDHIPGMLLLEAFRQTALIAANRYQGINPEEMLLSRCQVRFTRFGEFGLATTCRLTSDAVCLADDQETVLMSLLIEQDGQAIATASLELAALAGSAGVRLTEPLTLTQTQTAGV